MYVRSSMQLPSMAILACVMLAGNAYAQPAAAGPQMTADQLPELGDPMPDPSPAAAASPGRPRLMVARLDLDTPVSRLCADPRAKAVLDSDLPGLTTRPEFVFFKSMSLNTLKKMSRGQMSDADLAKVQAELSRLEDAPQGADQ